MAYYKRRCDKCICAVPNVENWVVIRKFAYSSAIRCKGCGQIWHSCAGYIDELHEEPVSDYIWRKLIRTDAYHCRMDDDLPWTQTLEGEPADAEAEWALLKAYAVLHPAEAAAE